MKKTSMEKSKTVKRIIGNNMSRKYSKVALKLENTNGRTARKGCRKSSKETEKMLGKKKSRKLARK